MGNQLPNFSMMTTAELSAWHWRYSNAGRNVAAEVLPGKPKGYIGIVHDIAQVCWHLFQANIAKEKKDERKVRVERGEAERLWVELPNFAKPIID